MIKEILLIEGLEFDLDVHDKDELFKVLTNKLYVNNFIENEREFLEALYHREKEGVTGMEDGMAIPHGLSSTVKRPVILFAKLKEPIEYESLDNKPIDKVFMIAVPDNSGNEHLKIISTLARKLVHPEFLEKLNQVTNKEEFLELF